MRVRIATAVACGSTVAPHNFCNHASQMSVKPNVQELKMKATAASRDTVDDVNPALP